MIKFHLQAIRYSRVTGQRSYTQVPRAFDGITAATAAQFLSFASVRLYIPKKKKERPLIAGRGG